MQYIIDRSAPIGSGGTSKIYRCQDAIGIRGVCKVMPKKEGLRRKFENEVACLRSLSYSPKVVQLFDAVEADTEYVLVMEWCRGGAVRDYIGGAGPGIYSENTVASIMRGVLRGLVHIHNAGIVHMDIKPCNVLFTDTSNNAEVKIADFGSAVRMGLEDRGITGTPWYMSPESLRSEITPKNDVWSAGVMAYQLLTGRMPFDDVGAGAPRVSHIWRKIILEDPVWTGPLWDAVSSDARSFVQLCLTKDPNARPTAMECIVHPWLEKTGCEDRFTGTPLVRPGDCRNYDKCSLMHARTWEMYAK
jgi:calcium-dependent protein kinase